MGKPWWIVTCIKQCAVVSMCSPPLSKYLAKGFEEENEPHRLITSPALCTCPGPRDKGSLRSTAALRGSPSSQLLIQTRANGDRRELPGCSLGRKKVQVASKQKQSPRNPRGRRKSTSASPGLETGGTGPSERADCAGAQMRPGGGSGLQAEGSPPAPASSPPLSSSSPRWRESESYLDFPPPP